MFAITPVPIFEYLARVVAGIRRSLMPDPVLPNLYHYTSDSGLIGITTTRSLRATCADCLADSTEIHHGAELLAEIVDSRLAKQTQFRKLTRLVLERLRTQPQERKSKTYIACFCESSDLAHLWDRYGSYCLRFSVAGDSGPQLKPRAWNVSVQFVQAIYGVRDQYSALASLVEQVCVALEDRSTIQGDIDGPWTQSIVQYLSFWVAELALDVLVSFKSEQYADEREWRLVVRPQQIPCWSDKLGPDRDFGALVKQEDGRRYVELIRRPLLHPLSPPSARPIPFDSVIVPSGNDTSRFRETAERILRQNSRSDIPVEFSPTRQMTRPVTQ